MPRPIHFEFPADDPDRAVRFYENAFGWKFQKWQGPQEYWLISTGSDEPGIDGGMARRRDPKEAGCNTIGVASLDETVKRVERAGGAVVRPRMAVPGVGWLAYVRDTEGNVFGLMQSDETAA